MSQIMRERELLFATAQRWQQTADQLLEEAELVPLLSRFGEVCPTGSYRYGLMMGPDIDLHVISGPASRDEAAALLGALIHHGFWRQYQFGDFIQFPRPDLPRGYYLGLRSDFADDRWKIDIWYLSEEDLRNRDYDHRLAQPLPDDARALILAIKAARAARGWNVGGAAIYDAVLKEGIGSVEEFACRYVPASS